MERTKEQLAADADDLNRLQIEAALARAQNLIEAVNNSQLLLPIFTKHAILTFFML